jgi:hypothetical protein
LLRLVNAARLAPLEELIAGLSGSPAPRPTPPATNRAEAAPSNPPNVVSTGASTGAPTVAPQAMAARASASTSPEIPTRRSDVAPPPKPAAQSPEALVGLDAPQVAAIKSQVASQKKFLAELIENVRRWELDGGELRLYFSTEQRALAELLQGRDAMEKLRSIASHVLGQPLRVYVKLDGLPAAREAVRKQPNPRELQAKFETDPIVRGMIERFGGRISEVRPRDEE